jgi:hypothetical protein
MLGRKYVPRQSQRLSSFFRKKGQPPPSSQTTIGKLESVQDAVLALTPNGERQKYLRTLCVTLSSTLIQARWSLEQRGGHSIPLPFLALLIFWLSIVFPSFGLFAPANRTALVTLFLCSLAVPVGSF